MPQESSSSIGNLLLIHNLVTQTQLNEALIRQEREPHKRLGEILTEMGAVDPKQLPHMLKRQALWRKHGPRPEDVRAVVDWAAQNTAAVGHDIDAICNDILKDDDDAGSRKR